MAPTTKADPLMPTPDNTPGGASVAEPSTAISGQNDFFWSKKMECHASRKKAMLQKYGKKINELMVIEWKTKWICLFVVTLHVAVGVYAINQPSWLVWFLCCYVVGGTCAHNMFLAIHEVTHYTAFKSKFLNDLLAMWCNIPTLVPYAMHFKEYHYEHHRYLGWDGVDPDLPTALEARLLNNFWGKLFFLQFQVFFYAFRPMLVRPKFYNGIRCLNALFIFVADFALYKFFGPQLFIYMFTALWLGAGITPFAGHFLSEHYVLDPAERANHDKQEAAETHSYYGWLNFFAWNVGWHNEHHDFPNVPWSKLPELRALAPEFYENLPQTDSWFKCQMRFLFDPNINEWCRIRREKGAWARKGVLIPTTSDTKTMGAITSIQ